MRKIRTILLILLCYAAHATVSAQDFDLFKMLDRAKITYEVSDFNSYPCATFLFHGRETKIVKPKQVAELHPWIWRARFFGHESQTDLALLAKGYHLVYNDQNERLMNRQNLREWNELYNLLHKGGLSAKMVMEGMSRGAYYVMNWAAANPDKVAGIYLDNPLLDMKSMYYGPDGKARPDNEITKAMKDNWGIDRAGIAKFKESPMDKIDRIVAGHYPILILCAELDEAAVNSQNAFPFAEKVEAKGGDVTMIVKKGFKHHPHSFPDPTYIVNFLDNAIRKNVYGIVKQYDSYGGLALAGYQGWFSAPGDGSNRGWYHYAGQHGEFKPGNCTIDFWPEVSEYPQIYKTEFQFADGSPAYVPSEWDRSTVDTHFRWMREYGIDGVFVQRFVSEIKRPSSNRQLNKVWDSAIKAANMNNRAISVMYDLSGMRPGDEALLLKDIDALNTKYDFFHRDKNPSYLYHNGKPLVAVWGLGFGDRRAYGLKEGKIIIDALKKRNYSILIGVPTYWREFGPDTKDDPELHALIKECDIVMPWFVGRYDEQKFAAFSKLIPADMAWCKANGLDYAPLAFPGFSWVNMNPGSKPIPRNRGNFYWQQLSTYIKEGAEMLYLAMFDEIDEGTAIMKVSTNPPVGASAFQKVDEDLGSDYYLYLAGTAAKMLKKEIPLSMNKPERTRRAGNPFIRDLYLADPSAHVWTDGRLYVYPSHDVDPPRGCDLMDKYHVYSTDDMLHWTDHGEILSSSQVPWGRKEGGFMWAPDCAYKNGTYYYYFPHPSRTDWNHSWKIGIATSQSPAKDFKVQGYIANIDSVFMIDPCVFIDDDGTPYFYYGGGAKCKGAKLKDNMVELAEPLRDMQGLNDFHEGAWVFKYMNQYYLMYADNTPRHNKLLYAVSDHPLGPWQYKGVVMDGISSDTSHGSIVEYQGKWYLFYHTCDISGKGNLRSICFDELHFNADGTIQKVIPTVQLP